MLSFTYVTARKFVPHLRTITPFARLQLSKIITRVITHVVRYYLFHYLFLIAFSLTRERLLPL